MTPGRAGVVRRFGLLAIWAVMIAVFGVLRPEEFLTTGTVGAILSSQAPLLILALGLLPALTADTLDLSAPATLGIADTLLGELNAVHHWPLWAAAAVIVSCGALIGSLNAAFIVGFGGDPIVVTLGTGTLLGGAALGINIVPTAGISAWLVTLTRHPVLGLQLIFYLGLALALGTWYFATYTPTGRHLFFVGAGPDVARLTGINVTRYRTAALVYSGVIASITGILLAGTLGSSDPTIGPTYLLPVFAGIFLGATTITPGRFNAWGTVAAVYFLTTGVTGLELLGLSGWVNQVFYGAALVLAATFSRIVTRADPEGAQASI
ncbi:MAG: ABC transporter permease [Pseudonocardiales bacterium]|nr:ABC transporter permease [Pseudonocardiales bacterium]MBV9028737.1 ABC transporter permease [Pseudonocardiales bacterium]